MKLVKVPRIFLNTVLKGCVIWAKENNVTLNTDKEIKKKIKKSLQTKTF